MQRWNMGSVPEPVFQNVGGRRAERRKIDATVQFRSGTKRANVMVRDISRFGARIGGVYLAHVGDHFWLKLPMIEAIEARVAWVEDFEFGCEFARPLNEIVFDNVTRQIS